MQKVSFEHLIWSDLARLTRDTPGRLVSKLTNDIAFIQVAASAALSTAVRDTLSVIALAISMFYLDWVMSLIVLCVYPIAALPVAAISKRLRGVAKRTQNELGDMTSLLTEKLSSVRLIKSFRLENYATQRLDQSFEQVYDLRMKAVRARARLDPMLEALGGIAVAGVIAFAYWRIANGISTVGDFMGFVAALLMASQPIRALGNLSARINEGLAAAESFYGIIDEKPRIYDRPGAKELKVQSGTIRFEDVAFGYDEQTDDRAVSDFSLEVPGGRTVALVGRSGAGKSTVLNLVPRLFDVTHGRISIDGQDLRDLTLASLRGAVSIVAQDVTLFDDTIGANIAMGRLGAPESAIIAAAKAAAAHDFILAQPQGYATQIGDRGLRLSGGQRQRIALARAILKDAPILLLDEATSALDTESEQLVQEALARFTKNRTTLVIAHRLSTVQNADVICVMEAGTIAEIGTHRQLLADGGIYARFVRSQALSGTEVSPAL
jgi:subfamily B ATP-binding cassette protein MsbA